MNLLIRRTRGVVRVREVTIGNTTKSGEVLEQTVIIEIVNINLAMNNIQCININHVAYNVQI